MTETNIVQPGIMIIRQLLSVEEQYRVISVVTKYGNLKTEEKDWNFFGIRGRTFGSLSNYPDEDEDFLRQIFYRMRSLVEIANIEIPLTEATHLLTWFYPSKKGMGWHSDGYGGNNGDKDAPIYSLTVGNSCIFDWCPVGTERKDKQSATLASGDVIIFGGPERMMLHRVRRVLPGTFTENFDARINLTYRTLTQFTEDDEKEYQTDVYQERLEKEFAEKNKKE